MRCINLLGSLQEWRHLWLIIIISTISLVIYLLNRTWNRRKHPNKQSKRWANELWCQLSEHNQHTINWKAKFNQEGWGNPRNDWEGFRTTGKDLERLGRIGKGLSRDVWLKRLWSTIISRVGVRNGKMIARICREKRALPLEKYDWVFFFTPSIHWEWESYYININQGRGFSLPLSLPAKKIDLATWLYD